MEATTIKFGELTIGARFRPKLGIGVWTKVEAREDERSSAHYQSVHVGFWGWNATSPGWETPKEVIEWSFGPNVDCVAI